MRIWVERLSIGVGSRGASSGLDDAVFGQVAELHVAEGFPGADHRDVCSETLHAWDVVTEPAEHTQQFSTVLGVRVSICVCVLERGTGAADGGSHPFCPGLGALLLKVLVCLCLNLGGPFLGVVGPVVVLAARALPAGGAAFISATARETDQSKRAPGLSDHMITGA